MSLPFVFRIKMDIYKMLDKEISLLSQALSRRFEKFSLMIDKELPMH